MNKKAVLGLMLALVMPFAGYFIVKYYSENTVHMPGRYFTPDSVVVSEKKGKTVTDTIWHKVKNILSDYACLRHDNTKKCVYIGNFVMNIGNCCIWYKNCNTLLKYIIYYTKYLSSIWIFRILIRN